MRLLLAVGALAIAAAQLNHGRWVQLFPTGPNPSPRDWHTSAVIGGEIYVIGGSAEANVERFNPRTQSWSNLGDRTRLPGIQAADAAAAGGQLLAFGGKSDRQLNDLLSLKVGDPTAQWKEILTDDTIPERNGHSITIFAGVAIVFGGWNERQYFADLASLDLDFSSTPRWQPSRATGGPRGRNSHSMVAFGDSLYLFGGFSHNITQGPWVGCSHPLDNCVWYSDVWRYSPLSDTWNAVPPPVVGEIPRGRSRHSASVIGESMYVFGGQTQTVPNSDELWQYHIRENRWTLLRPLGDRAPGRSAHAAAVSGGVLYVFGGTGAQSTTYAYYPPSLAAADEEEAKALIAQ